MIVETRQASHGTTPDRPAPRYARPPHPANAHRHDAPRLGPRPTDRAAVKECAACRAGLALPGAATPRAARVDRERVAADRAESARALLQSHRVRAARARGGDEELAAVRPRGRPHSRGSLTCHAHARR